VAINPVPRANPLSIGFSRIKAVAMARIVNDKPVE
jgi:hypothetical protein